MNLVYLYDGSFTNLLSLIFYLFHEKIIPSQIKNQLYTPNLLEEVIDLKIPSDENIIFKIVEGIGTYNFRLVYDVFLSNDEQKEIILYYFLKNGLKYRKKISYQRNLKSVREVLKISGYVFHEIHKMKGFLRFKELENHILYAEMEPVNNIIFDLSLHFQKRLQKEYWIIKDVKRGLLSCYNKKNFILILEENFTLHSNKESIEEQEFAMLWKEFYKTIGIAERKNDRCRMNFMPKKYWKYITEMRENI